MRETRLVDRPSRTLEGKPKGKVGSFRGWLHLHQYRKCLVVHVKRANAHCCRPDCGWLPTTFVRARHLPMQHTHSGNPSLATSAMEKKCFTQRDGDKLRDSFYIRYLIHTIQPVTRVRRCFTSYTAQLMYLKNPKFTTPSPSVSA